MKNNPQKKILRQDGFPIGAEMAKKRYSSAGTTTPFLKQLILTILLFAILPVTALAAEGAPNTLYVGNMSLPLFEDSYWATNDSGELTRVNDATDDSNDWNVKYDPSTATLTLKDAKISGSFHQYNNPSTAGIYALSRSGQPVSLTIKLIGENTITGDHGIFVNAEIDASIFGADASLTITGKGSLDVSGFNHGIYVKSGTGDASLNINDASVVAKTTQTYSGGSAGVYVQSSIRATGSPQLSLKVNGGSLTASGSKGIDYQFGTGATGSGTPTVTVSNNAIMRANGGIANNSSSPIQYETGSNSTGGIVFDGNTGTVYGKVELQEDLEIGEGESLTIGQDASLSVPSDKTLTNNGRIINYGTINGTVTGKVAIPLTENMIIVADATYTGVKVTPAVTVEKYTEDTDYTVSYSDNINAGTAKVTVTPIDGSLLLGDAVTKEFTIAKADNEWTTALSMDGWTYGEEAKKPTAVAKFGTPIFTYSNEENGTYITEQPVNAGTWYVKATVEGTDNYTGLSEIKKFTIAKAPATLSFAKETVSATIGETVKNTLNVTPAGVAVLYSSSDETVATIDASTGAITLVGAGKTTITATINDPNYTGDPASYTLTVTEPYVPEPEPEPEPEPTYYRVDLRPVEGATVILSADEVEEGGTLTFTIEIAEGYVADDLMVTVSQGIGKAVEVKPDEAGVYTVKEVDGLVTITVYGVTEEPATAIERIETLRIYAAEGILHVETPTRQRVTIVSMAGALIADGEQEGARIYRDLNAGVYIVRVGDYATKVRVE